MWGHQWSGGPEAGAGWVPGDRHYSCRKGTASTRQFPVLVPCDQHSPARQRSFLVMEVRPQVQHPAQHPAARPGCAPPSGALGEGTSSRTDAGCGSGVVQERLQEGIWLAGSPSLACCWPPAGPAAPLTLDPTQGSKAQWPRVKVEVTRVPGDLQSAGTLRTL